jgi:predicted nucleic acid-binding protein
MFSSAASDDAIAWCERASELALSIIAIPEVLSAFARLRREGSLDDRQYADLKAALLSDVEDALICDMTVDVVAVSIDVLEASPLRAMDAIHVAAALECGAEVFVSADARQCVAASLFELQVVQL